MKRSTLLPSILAATIAALSHNTAVADTLSLEEIVVTAQKRAESLQDVPISVSAVSGDTIRDAGIPDFEELSATIPNFAVSRNAIQDTVSIRGVNSDSQSGGEQSVGIYVDGVFRGRGVQSRFAFLDVGMVEVLRGPQGTLFGKNTIAGALNISSAKPTEEFESSISAKYETEHQETELQGHVSGALSDTVRGRIAFLDRQFDDGWVENSGYNETMDNHEWAVRGTLDIDISDNLMATVKYERGEFDNTGAPYDTIVHAPGAAAYPGESTPWNSKINIQNSGPGLDLGTSYYMEGDSDELSARFDLDTEAGTWTTILGYSTYHFERGQDADFGPLPVLSYIDREDFEQRSVEVRFASDNDGNVSWLAGAYWQDSELEATGDTPVNSGFLSVATAGAPIPLSADWATLAGTVGNVNRQTGLDQDASTWALFGQATFQISDTVSTTLGLRYGEEEKDGRQWANVSDLSGNGITGGALTGPVLFAVAPLDVSTHSVDNLHRDEESLSWTANVAWDATDDIMAYATVSTGFKGGGFNSVALGVLDMATGQDVTTQDDIAYDEEEAISYEIGAKMTLADGAAEVNLAYFFMEFDDLQTTQFTGSTGFVVANAAQAETQGIEMDWRWQVSEEVRLSGSLGWIDFEFKDYATAGCTSEQITTSGLNAAGCSAAGINDLSGKTNQDTPELSASLSALWVTQVMDNYELRSQLDLVYSDEYYAAGDLDPNVIQDSFTKTNVSFTFAPQDGQWDVSVIANNITNEETYQYANDVPLFAGNHFGMMQRPRTLAIRGRLNF